MQRFKLKLMMFVLMLGCAILSAGADWNCESAGECEFLCF